MKTTCDIEIMDILLKHKIGTVGATLWTVAANKNYYRDIYHRMKIYYSYYSSIFLVLHITISLQVSLEWIPYAEFLKMMIWKGCRWPAVTHNICVSSALELLSTESTTTLRHAFGGSTPAMFKSQVVSSPWSSNFSQAYYTRHILVSKMWLKGTGVKADGSQKYKDKNKHNHELKTSSRTFPAHASTVTGKFYQQALLIYSHCFWTESLQKVFQSKASKVLKF